MTVQFHDFDTDEIRGDWLCHVTAYACVRGSVTLGSQGQNCNLFWRVRSHLDFNSKYLATFYVCGLLAMNVDEFRLLWTLSQASGYLECELLLPLVFLPTDVYVYAGWMSWLVLGDFEIWRFESTIKVTSNQTQCVGKWQGLRLRIGEGNLCALLYLIASLTVTKILTNWLLFHQFNLIFRH